jgi:hypothetical protein
MGAYHHGLFLRGLPELARGIRRLRTKGCGPRRGRRDEVVTPDHYAMPFLPVPGSITTESAGANIQLSPLVLGAVGGGTLASVSVLLSTIPLPQQESSHASPQQESSHASTVASLTEGTLCSGIEGIRSAVPSLHDWAVLLHWRRVLLQERQELEQQLQNRLLASTLEAQPVDIVRALTIQTDLATAAAPQDFVSGPPLDNQDALTMRLRPLAVALLQNLNNV